MSLRRIIAVTIAMTVSIIACSSSHGGFGQNDGGGGTDAALADAAPPTPMACDGGCAGNEECVSDVCCPKARACNDQCCGASEVCSFGACAALGKPCGDS